MGVGLVFCLWGTNHCMLFTAKSSLYRDIRYMEFGLVSVYGISTIVGYLPPNPLYTEILDIWESDAFFALILGLTALP